MPEQFDICQARVFLVVELDDGQDRRGQPEGDDPCHKAGETSLGLGANFSGLQWPADGIVTLHGDGQNGENAFVGHCQLNKWDSKTHELKPEKNMTRLTKGRDS